VWATAGPNTFDCSGLVEFCVQRCTGKAISRSSYDQARLGTQVTGALRQGDILYYGNGSHVGIVTGTNRQVTALNENAGVVVAQIPGNMGLVYNGARRIVSGGLVNDTPATAPSSRGGTTYSARDVAGSNRPLYLPDWLGFRQQLTPLGIINTAVGLPNRSGAPMRPTVTVFHSTNNPRDGENAAAHANWQAKGTPGHPDGVVAVHFYVDAHEVVQVLPIDEQGIHAGDWRNEWGIAVERTCNADQVQAEAENNAMHVHAALLWIIGTTAKESMYPHTNGGHCPQLIRPWPEVEQITDMRIDRIEGQHHA
jgi:hypothetical protein